LDVTIKAKEKADKNFDKLVNTNAEDATPNELVEGRLPSRSTFFYGVVIESASLADHSEEEPFANKFRSTQHRVILNPATVEVGSKICVHLPSWGMILGHLLSLRGADWSHLDALVTEHAVAQAIQAEGHHVGGFGFWALRRRARRKDIYERILHRPKDWAWLALGTAPPPSLSAPDSALLARLVHALHGVQYIQWTPEPGLVCFTSWSLRSTVVRGVPVLTPGRPRPEGHLDLTGGPFLPDVSR